jgi:hypothetical protein
MVTLLCLGFCTFNGFTRIAMSRYFICVRIHASISKFLNIIRRLFYFKCTTIQASFYFVFDEIFSRNNKKLIEKKVIHRRRSNDNDI